MSVATGGEQGNGDNRFPTISADGRFVAFVSDSTNLVPGDTNDVADVFVRDRLEGTTERASVGTNGTEGNGGSGFNAGFGFTTPAISANGRFVAFLSDASNLVPGGTNGGTQAFVRDRQAGTTILASVSSSGAQAGYITDPRLSISANGRYVVFGSEAPSVVKGDTNRLDDVFVRDLLAGTTERVSVSSRGVQAKDGRSSVAGISSNGRFVVFASYASNLVPGDTNGNSDAFVRDRQTKTTERVSVSSSGVQGKRGSSGGWISGDGRFVVFFSESTNLVPGDTNGSLDAFVRDRQTKTTERVSVSSSGVQGNYDSRVGREGRTITQDGRFVVFFSEATNLVPGDTGLNEDVFVRDRVDRLTTRASTSSSGAQGNSSSEASSISGDGRFVAFESAATNLVPNDTNDQQDVFVRTR